MNWNIKGTFETTVNVDGVDVVYGFKFGTMASSITEDALGFGVTELFSRIANKKDLTKCLLYFFYGAAVAYARVKTLAPPTVDEVSDMIDQIGFDECLKIYNNAIQLPTPKNAEPPKV